MNHAERKAGLEALLLRFQPLWRPQPFRIETPDWCADYPALTAELLALDDDETERLAGDNAALIERLLPYEPELGPLADFIDLPRHDRPLPASPNNLFVEVPGRKRAQIEAYADALGEPEAPVLEWCAGKGHLGRLLAHRWHLPVASLEIEAPLCREGAHLARHAKLDDRQGFINADALAADSTHHLTERHAVALHACGDLHTRLVAGTIEQDSPALALAPCCYYRTVHDPYRPFNDTPLSLNHDDLRLAVTETVTASARLRRQSRRALAWKLAWVELRKALTGEMAYRTFPPVPEAWLRDDFAGFIERMAKRESVQLHTPILHYEALGHARAARMLRLQLVRLAFRRPLEVWLLMDMALHLERNGYDVAVTQFCAPALTPRNLLLSARRM